MNQLPPEIFNQHCAILGKTGAGKSYAARGMVETLLAQHRRVCVIDPKGDWHGLKLDPDGKRGPFKVIGFGDFKEPKATDIPINARAGKEVAELVAAGNRPCVIGFRGWMPGDRTRFWVDFAATLFNKNHAELFLVVDEIHNFAMQGKVLDPEAGKCLHWTNRIASEGRGMGIKLIMASQRPQKVHKDTLTCAETLIAMRVIHPLDRAAMKDWIDGCGDKATGEKVLNELANMARGTAWVWSPEIGFLEKVNFPRINTFDSFSATATVSKPMALTWEGTDLDEVRLKLASIVEEAKTNDPRELRARVAALQKELRERPEAKTEKVVEKVSFLTDEDRELLKELDGSICAAGLQFAALQKSVEELKAKLPQQPKALLPQFARAVNHADRVIKNPEPGARPPMLRHAQNSNGSLPVGERAILTGCAQYPGGVAKETLSVLTGYKRSSRDAYLQRLMGKGYAFINDGNCIATEEGVSALGDFEPLPVGDALQSYWRTRLPEGEMKILDVLVSAYPESVDRDSLCDSTGYKRSSRDAYIQRLKSRKLVVVTGGRVAATETLFD